MPLLALVVSTRTDVVVAADLAAAARARHVDVEMFFMDRAVAELAAAPNVRAQLVDLGCELIACASSAEQLGVDSASLANVLLGSQDDHAAAVHKADRVVAFT